MSSNNFENRNITTALTNEKVTGSTPLPEVTTADEETAKKSHIRHLIMVLGGSATAVAAGITLAFALNAGPNTETKNEPLKEGDQPVATALASPEATAPTETSAPTETLDVTVAPGDVVEYNLFEKLTPEAQAEIQKMDAMSVEDFRTLPYEEQYKFARFVYDNNIDILKYRLDYNGLSQIYQDANLDTAQGIVNTRSLRISLLASLKTESLDGASGFDSITARKGAALLTNSTDLVFYENIDAEISTWNVNTPALAPSSKVPESVIKADGDYLINTIDDANGGHSQMTSHIEQMTLIDGSSVPDAITLLLVDQGDPRFIQNIG